MSHWFSALNRILRGDATRLEALRSETIEAPVFGLSIVLILLGILYGACMGCYAMLRTSGADWRQLIACMFKVPAVFFLTLLVTFPSLYVFNALVGSRLTFSAAFRLIVAAMSIMLCVLASFGTIVAFFSFTTDSYHFMVLLNVLVFAVSGMLGLKFLMQTLHRLTIVQEWRNAQEAATTSAEIPPTLPPPQSPPPVPADPSQPQTIKITPGAVDRIDQRSPARQVTAIFRIWVLVYSLVGAQMAWILRPFIGNPDLAFTWFRPRESNFFEGVFRAIVHLLNIDGWR